MGLKRFFIISFVFCFLVGTISFAWSAADNRNDAGLVTGKITAIKGNQLTIQDGNKSFTIPVAGPETADKHRTPVLQNFRVGDQVKGQLKNGKIIGLERLQ